MELDETRKIREEPRVSGPSIHSFMKNLTSSRPKDPDFVAHNSSSSVQKRAKHVQVLAQAKQAHKSTEPQQHKKQVRRRFHTSRPYKERFLNLAEARREIVTALKFHRATMKQKQQQQKLQEQQSQQQPPSLPNSHQPSNLEKDGRIKSSRNTRIYPSNTTNFSNYMQNFSMTPIPYSCPTASSIAPNSLPRQNPSFILPDKNLGLSLDFQIFNNIDATLCYKSNNTSLFSYSSLSPSPLPREVPSLEISKGEGSPKLMGVANNAKQDSGGFHAAMEDKELAEIRSIGEQHQTEWSDTMSLVTSARWSKFLKTMELVEESEQVKVEDDEYHLSNHSMEFPAWLNFSESCLDQCSDDYLEHIALPCMDIGDIEGTDGEWLA